MANADDIVDVKVEEEVADDDWEVMSEPEETDRKTASGANTRLTEWKKMRVDLENGGRQAVDYDLIAEVKKYPVMYDPLHPHNRDTFLKEKTWREIGQAINVGPEYCKLRWKSIRDRFVKTEKQERARKANGVRKLPKPYRFAAHLTFLRRYLREKTQYKMQLAAPLDVEEDATIQDSPSDKDNADDSSVSDYGWAPTGAVPAASPSWHRTSTVDKQLHEPLPHHSGQSNGVQRAPHRPHEQELGGDARSVTYYDVPSPAGNQPTPQDHPLPGARRDAGDGDPPSHDEVTYFLISLAPAMRRLPAEQQSLARIKMQTLLHEMEFNK